MFWEMVLFGFVVGIALGLSGGGGSIFAVPLLVYGAGVPVHEALLTSLVVVGSTAFFGACLRIKAGEVDLRATATMVVTGLIFAPCGAVISNHLPGRVIMFGFACLMVIVGILMWRSAKKEDSGVSLSPSEQRRPLSLILGGAGTGFLNGLFGVGGGFLIVPTLVFAASLPIRRAMATSLLVIACVSVFSVFTHFFYLGKVDYQGMALFLCGGIVGITMGTVIAKRIESTILHKGFAVMVIIVGLVVLGVYRSV